MAGFTSDSREEIIQDLGADQASASVVSPMEKVAFYAPYASWLTLGIGGLGFIEAYSYRGLPSVLLIAISAIGIVGLGLQLRRDFQKKAR